MLNPNIAADGEVVRVPLLLMDGVQRSIAADPLNAHRPGVRLGTSTVSDDDRANAYDAYHERLANGWKQPARVAPTPSKVPAPVASPPVADGMEAVYASYDARLRDAWKGAQ